ncbi:uncharacterized protein LOC136033215 isoform X1 [Artemia franciscana]
MEQLRNCMNNFLTKHLSIEVKSVNAYCEAILIDVTDTEIVVTFEDLLAVMGGQKDFETKNYPFAEARLPPLEGPTVNVPSYAKGQEIEVKCRSDYPEPIEWCRATIEEIMINGQYVSVKHLDKYEAIELESGFVAISHTQIVPVSEIRVPNPNPSLTREDYYKFQIPVPVDSRDFLRKNGVQKEFQRCIAAAICAFVPERESLVCISRAVWSKKIADKLSSYYFRSISQKDSRFKETEMEKIRSTALRWDSRPFYTSVSYTSGRSSKPTKRPAEETSEQVEKKLKVEQLMKTISNFDRFLKETSKLVENFDPADKSIDVIEETTEKGTTFQISHANRLPQVTINEATLRHVTIDGANVGYRYSSYIKRDGFNSKGVQLVYQHFKRRGHEVSVVLVETWRRRLKVDPSMQKISDDGAFVYTPVIPEPGNRNRKLVLYDDLFTVQLASEKQGVIVSGDFYRDIKRIVKENNNQDWLVTLNSRLLVPTFTTDDVSFDPLPYGPAGPPLQSILRK